MFSSLGSGRLLALSKPAALPRPTALALGQRSTHRIFLRNYRASPLPCLQHWQPLRNEASKDDTPDSSAATELSASVTTNAPQTGSAGEPDRKTPFADLHYISTGWSEARKIGLNPREAFCDAAEAELAKKSPSNDAGGFMSRSLSRRFWRALAARRAREKSTAPPAAEPLELPRRLRQFMQSYFPEGQASKNGAALQSGPLTEEEWQQLESILAQHKLSRWPSPSFKRRWGIQTEEEAKASTRPNLSQRLAARPSPGLNETERKTQRQKRILLQQAKQAQGAASLPQANEVSIGDRDMAQESGPQAPPPTLGKTPPPQATLHGALRSLGDNPRADQQADFLPSVKTVQPDASFSFSASSIPFDQVTPSFSQPPVATLAHGLSRVLFNPGVHWLQHPRTQVYNYPRWLQSLVSPAEFNYDALPGYVTSSRDNQLWQLAEENGARFAGSTSSMTSSLSQVYFMLNPKKKLNFGMLSSSYDVSPMADFSAGARMPASIVLRHRNGRYAIDSDNLDANVDDPDETILSDLGHVMEKFFVLKPEAFERMLKKNSHLIDPKEKLQREAYAFGKSHSLFTRSQLDCFNELLPGNGTFDIKTRAVVAVRQDRLNHANAAGYQIRHERGTFESFEREHYDLIRTAYLKYQFQARIGHMDGIFCAFHNTQRVFGFEYIPLGNMDEALFGSREEGDKVFKLSLAWFERILNDAAETYPGRDIGITLWTRGKSGRLLAFVYPHSDSAGTSVPKEYTLLQYANYNYLDGEIVDGQAVDIAGWVENNLGADDAAERARLEWSVFGQMTKVERGERTDAMFNRVRQQQLQVSQLMVPEAVRETATKQAQPSPLDADRPAPSAKIWAPTPGKRYRTAPSELVKKLRALARDGWRHLESQQAPKEIVTVEPVQYRVEKAAQKAAQERPGVTADGDVPQKES